MWKNQLENPCTYGPATSEQCQVQHWRFTGIIKDEKEDNVAGVSQEGFIKNRFYQNKAINFSYPYVFDR